MIKRGLFATALGGRGRGGPRRFGLHGRAVVMEVLGAVRLSASSRKTPVDEVILGKTEGGRAGGSAGAHEPRVRARVSECCGCEIHARYAGLQASRSVGSG